MRRNLRDDRGVSALWVAVVALFLVAAAALAVDTSGAFNTAQTDQTTADLSCLGGVKELPDTTAAINLAVEYAVDNWPEMDGHSTTISGTTGTYSDGNGSEIYVDAAYGGDPDKMQIRITEVGPTYFGKAIGADSTTVRQNAYCRLLEQSAGTGVPFGAPLGGFIGGIFGPNPCGPNQGNCASLYIERDDSTGQRDTLVNNIAHGPDRNLDAWLGNQAGSSSCSTVSAGDTCHWTNTDTGVSSGHLRPGFLERFENDPDADCEVTVRGHTINCDSPEEILGGSPTPLDPNEEPPDGWIESIHGEYNAANTTNHYYYNDVIAKCDSPRLARMPIVTEDMNWDIGGPAITWPPGTSAPVKFVDFYWVIIETPDDPSDFQGNLSVDGIVMWWGPDTECAGPGGTTYEFDPNNPTIDEVYLVNETN